MKKKTRRRSLKTFIWKRIEALITDRTLNLKKLRNRYLKCLYIEIEAEARTRDRVGGIISVFSLITYGLFGSVVR